MDIETINNFLEESLADTHFSRRERKAMSRILAAAEGQPKVLNQIRKQIFEKAREAMTHGRDRAIVDWMEDLLNALEGRRKLPKTVQTQAYFSPGKACRAQIIENIHRSKKQVDICVFTITDNHICEALESIHRRGIRLRIISDNHKSNDRGSDIDRLSQMGIPVKIDHTHFHMHHKFALFDRERVLTGSYNWTISAADANNENIVILNDPKAIRSFTGEFERLWQALRDFPR